MSVTTRFDLCLHWQFNPEPSYFHHISSRGPSVPHHFEYDGGKFWEEGHGSLPTLARGWYIMEPNEKGMADSETKTGRGGDGSG